MALMVRALKGGGTQFAYDTPEEIPIGKFAGL
jgi:hypothetical protein